MAKQPFDTQVWRTKRKEKRDGTNETPEYNTTAKSLVMEMRSDNAMNQTIHGNLQDFVNCFFFFFFFIFVVSAIGCESESK